MSGSAANDGYRTKLNLLDLVQSLKNAGFAVGPHETIEAVRLIKKLAEGQSHLNIPEHIKPKLRPIFCKSLRDQQYFDKVFNDWLETASVRRQTDNASTAVSDGNKLKSGTSPSSKQRPPRAYLWACLVVVAFVAIIAYRFQNNSRESLSKSEPTSAPKVTSNPDPGPMPTGTPPEVKPSPEANIVVLRQVWCWLAIGLPGLSALLFTAPVLLLARTRLKSTDREIQLDGWPRQVQANLVVTPLGEGLVGRIARHIQGPADEQWRFARRPQADLRLTVKHTIQNLGIPKPYYRRGHLRPSYLFLVEADSVDTYSVFWAERFRNLGIDATIYHFKYDKRNANRVPMAFNVANSFRNEQLPMDRLPHPPFGQRLVLISNGECLVDQHGNWREWAKKARFKRWPYRVLFTPTEPRRWGALEEAIERPEYVNDVGFIVLPLDDNALEAWVEYLVTGTLPEIRLSRPQRYPPLLYTLSEDDLLDNDRPIDNVKDLIGQLKLYLGENGFYWLCTCAVPPIMDRRLTLLLGEELLRRSGATNTTLPYHFRTNFGLLSRLPWIEKNFIPDWLSLALLACLPLSIQAEVRRAVDGLLAPQRPRLHGDLHIRFDLDANTTKSDEQYDRRNALYVGFMSGLNANQLTSFMPSTWGPWIREFQSPRNFVQKISDWAGAFPTAIACHYIRPTRFALWLTGSLLVSGILFMTIVATSQPPLWPLSVREWLFTDQEVRMSFGRLVMETCRGTWNKAVWCPIALAIVGRLRLHSQIMNMSRNPKR